MAQNVKDFASPRCVSNWSDEGVHVFEKRTVSGSQIQDHQVRAGRKMMSIGKEATVRRPCGAGIPANSRGELAGIASVNGHKPNLAQKADRDLRSVGRNTWILRAAIQSHLSSECPDSMQSQRNCKARHGDSPAQAFM
jgi:hypothetical protein